MKPDLLWPAPPPRHLRDALPRKLDPSVFPPDRIAAVASLRSLADFAVKLATDPAEPPVPNSRTWVAGVLIRWSAIQGQVLPAFDWQALAADRVPDLPAARGCLLAHWALGPARDNAMVFDLVRGPKAWVLPGDILVTWNGHSGIAIRPECNGCRELRMVGGPPHDGPDAGPEPRPSEQTVFLNHLRFIVRVLLVPAASAPKPRARKKA